MNNSVSISEWEIKKKASSFNKIIKLNDYQNMTLLYNYPNLMTISLSKERRLNINKMNNKSENINNILITFYLFKNNNKK